jgi:Zn-dependent membrane protease YugP
VKCDFCLANRQSDHACPDTPTVRKRQQRYLRHSLAQIDSIVHEIKHSQVHPNWKPETSEQMRLRADRKRDIVVAAKLAGAEVKIEWQ